jgi:ribulose-phosphate 3-epimerase
MAKIGASVICMDPLRIGEHIEICERIKIDRYHIDVMDANCVPRYGIYPEIVERISQVSKKPIDVHLMSINLDFTIDQFIDIPQVKTIFFHIDNNESNLFGLFDKIRNRNKQPGLVFNMSTGFDSVLRVIRHEPIDCFMFMGIHPGVLSQKSRPNHLLIDVPEFLSRLNYSPSYIQCDGGVQFETISPLRRAGVTDFVCGSSTLFKGVDFNTSMMEQEKIITRNMVNIKKALSDV